MTKQQLLEEEIKTLEEENKQLRHVISNVPSHVYWKNRQHIYLGCNQGILDLFQLTDQKDFIGN